MFRQVVILPVDNRMFFLRTGRKGFDWKGVKMAIDHFVDRGKYVLNNKISSKISQIVLKMFIIFNFCLIIFESSSFELSQFL